MCLPHQYYERLDHCYNMNSGLRTVSIIGGEYDGRHR